MRTLTIVLVSFLFGVAAALAAAVDRVRIDGPAAALLASLEQVLDGRGVDVRFGMPTADTEEMRQSRPQLAPLETLPASLEINENDLAGFERLFVQSVGLRDLGIETALIAVDGAGDLVPRQDQPAFLDAWESAPRERRVFLSFTKADLSEAMAVAAGMREQGYAVFVYIDVEDAEREALNDGDTTPVTNSVDVGRRFEEAGVRVVLDTDNARMSKGTQIERSTHQALLDGSLRRRMGNDFENDVVTLEIVDAEMLGSDNNGIDQRALASGGCCRWCRSGGSGSGGDCASIFKNCGPVSCGAFCGGT